MKAIVNKKLYDTAKADIVLKWDNGYFSSDFKFRSKDLYRTPKGVFFIHHVGGALTDMAHRFGTCTGGSQRIEPVSDDDAFNFCCSHDGVAEAQKYFPDRIEEA